MHQALKCEMLKPTFARALSPLCQLISVRPRLSFAGRSSDAFPDLEAIQDIPQVSCSSSCFCICSHMWDEHRAIHTCLVSKDDFILLLYSILYQLSEACLKAQDGQQENSHKLWEDILHSQETFREGPSRPGAQAARRIWPQKQERGRKNKIKTANNISIDTFSLK